MRCDYCGKEVENLIEIGMSGADDYYQLEVCEVCDEYLSGDYFSPDDVTKMFNG